MAHSNETRRKVRTAYVQGMALKQACGVHGVNYETARRWKADADKAGDNWDLARSARRMSTSGLEAFANEVLEHLAEEFTAVIAAIKADRNMPPATRIDALAKLSDSYCKALSSGGRAMPNANRLGVAMEVIKWLTDRVADRAPAIRGPFVEVMESLGDELVREFGSGL